MSDWLNPGEPEDLISLTDLDEDELNLLTEVVFGTQDKKTLKSLSETVKQNFVILDERDHEKTSSSSVPKQNNATTFDSAVLSRLQSMLRHLVAVR